MQINRGLFNVAVTQQHLNGPQVCTVFEQVCGEGCADAAVSGYGNAGQLGGRPTKRLCRRWGSRPCAMARQETAIRLVCVEGDDSAGAVQ
jgi:hypothetical protein